MKQRFISLLRVSTDKQGISGLGLEAQRDHVGRYIEGVGGELNKTRHGPPQLPAWHRNTREEAPAQYKAR